MSVFVACLKCDTRYPSHFEFCPRCSTVTPPPVEPPRKKAKTGMTKYDFILPALTLSNKDGIVAVLRSGVMERSVTLTPSERARASIGMPVERDGVTWYITEDPGKSLEPIRVKAVI